MTRAAGRQYDKGECTRCSHPPYCKIGRIQKVVVYKTYINNRKAANTSATVHCCKDSKAVSGSATVFIENLAAYRKHDRHKCGKLIEGSPNVFFG